MKTKLVKSINTKNIATRLARIWYELRSVQEPAYI